MKYIKFFLIFLFFVSVKNYTYAENNVAFINMQYIMDKSLAGQSLKKQLEQLHKKNIGEFKKNEDSLKKKRERNFGKKKYFIKRGVSKRNFHTKE